jgi:hypothetical protein
MTKIKMFGEEEEYDIELPDWVKTYEDLEKLHLLQRQVFLKKLVDKYQPLGGIVRSGKEVM